MSTGVVCPKCGDWISFEDDPDADEGDLCCMCETDLIHATRGDTRAPEKAPAKQ